MGRASRSNPCSPDGRKAAVLVEQARLEVAPLRVLLRTWVTLMWRRFRG